MVRSWEREGKKQDKPTTARSKEVRESTVSHYYGIKCRTALGGITGKKLLEDHCEHAPCLDCGGDFTSVPLRSMCQMVYLNSIVY